MWKKINRWHLFFGSIALLLLGLLAIPFYFKWSLASYIAELQKKGETLEVSKLIPEKCEDDSAVEAVWNAYSTFPQMPVEMPRLMEPAGPGKARVAWKIYDHTEEDRLATSNLVLFAKGVKKEELSKLLKGLEAECLTLGYNFDFTRGSPGLARIKTITQSLQQLSLWHMRNEDYQQALKCLHGVLNGITGSTKDPVMIVHLVRIACASISATTTWELLEYDGWSDHELASLQASWEKQNFRGDLALIERIERALAMDFLNKISNREQLTETLIWGQQTTIMDTLAEAGDQLLSNPRHSFQLLAEAGLMGGAYPYWQLFGKYREKEMFLRNVQNQIEKVEQIQISEPISHAYATNKFKPPLLSVAFGDYKTKFFSVVARAECVRDMVVAAIALKRHKLKSGGYPESLEALVPNICSQLPIDWHNGEPLKYRKLTDGTYLLYGVGENLKDEAGESGNRLFVSSTNDMVWPKAATLEEIKQAEEIKRRKRR